jgi:hypothetical protein
MKEKRNHQHQQKENLRFPAVITLSNLRTRCCCLLSDIWALVPDVYYYYFLDTCAEVCGSRRFGRLDLLVLDARVSDGGQRARREGLGRGFDCRGKLLVW